MPTGTHVDGAGDLVRKLRNLRGKYKDQPRVTVGYRMPYAVYVHERLDVYHPVGRAKYLEAPARKYRREMGEAVRRAMRKGGTTLREACRQAGLFLQRKSQELCPVDTGALRNSAFTVVE